MGTPLRSWIIGCALVALWALVSIATLASTARADSLSPGALTALTVSRLDTDPVPARVIAAEFDEDFIAGSQAVIREHDSEPRWWRITAEGNVPAEQRPQLVLRAPHLAQVEVWLPGQALPVRRSIMGADADLDYSTRALVVPLAQGLEAGESVLLRLRGPAAPMPVSIQTLAQVHRADLVHVAWRTTILVSLLLMALLALGFWLGIGERSYGYLFLTLFAEAVFFATVGGEVRLLPGVGAVIQDDPRIPLQLGLVGALCGMVFLVHYLELRIRQPRTLWALVGCGAALLVLVLVSLFGVRYWVEMTTYAILLITALVVLAASVIGCLQRQRAAVFVLLSWLPLVGLMFLRVGELLGLLPISTWIGYAIPAAFVLSALVIMIGLSDTLQQLRRDRDRASRLATYDALTGALSRPAIEERLQASVADSNRTGMPLSVVFLDIDRFKQINDKFGHGVGDNCLKIIALRTRNRLRTYDLFGRWGGDEILVLLPDTRLGEALGVAENLRSAVNCRPLSIDGHLLDASLSLGVAQLAAGETAEHLVERADAALYSSKSAGRDRVTVHDPRVTGNHPRFVEAVK